MGTIQEEWASDAAEILNEIPKAVTVRRGTGTAVAFNILISPPMVEQNLETGGFLSTTSYDIKFLRADINAHPGVVVFGNIVTYNGAGYRIVAINDRPPSAWIMCRVQVATGPA
jgi:hypothetical protein